MNSSFDTLPWAKRSNDWVATASDNALIVASFTDSSPLALTTVIADEGESSSESCHGPY